MSGELCCTSDSCAFHIPVRCCTGTRWRNSGNILWCILGLMTVIVVAVCYFLLKELSFILKPVGMAYFLCLLLQPAVDLLEQVKLRLVAATLVAWA